MSKIFNKPNYEFGKKIVSGIGQAVNKVKTKINKTKLDKIKSRNTIAETKAKASEAKLGQTQFEIKNKMPITFKSNKGKSESNTESYKRIQKDNTEVIKGMLDKAAGKK
jgi:acid phosphatase class B